MEGAGSFLPYDEMQSVDAHAAIAYPLEFRITKHVPPISYPIRRLSAPRSKAHAAALDLVDLWRSWPSVSYVGYPHINFCIGQWVIVRDPPSSRVYVCTPTYLPVHRPRERERGEACEWALLLLLDARSDRVDR